MFYLSSPALFLIDLSGFSQSHHLSVSRDYCLMKPAAPQANPTCAPSTPQLVNENMTLHLFFTKNFNRIAYLFQEYRLSSQDLAVARVCTVSVAAVGFGFSVSEHIMNT